MYVQEPPLLLRELSPCFTEPRGAMEKSAEGMDRDARSFGFGVNRLAEHIKSFRKDEIATRWRSLHLPEQDCPQGRQRVGVMLNGYRVPSVLHRCLQVRLSSQQRSLLPISGVPLPFRLRPEVELVRRLLEKRAHNLVEVKEASRETRFRGTRHDGQAVHVRSKSFSQCQEHLKHGRSVRARNLV